MHRLWLVKKHSVIDFVENVLCTHVHRVVCLGGFWVPAVIAAQLGHFYTHKHTEKTSGLGSVKPSNYWGALLTLQGVPGEAQLADDVAGDVRLDALALLGMALSCLQQVVELLGVELLKPRRDSQSQRRRNESDIKLAFMLVASFVLMLWLRATFCCCCCFITWLCSGWFNFLESILTHNQA